MNSPRRSSTIKELKILDHNKIWVLYDNLVLEDNMIPEYKCTLMKKGQIFTNSYEFVFYNDFCLVTKVK